MARLSFIEQERIARNMTDADILGEYEQEGSVLPPGIQIDKNVLLGEMDGRTYVRDATSAAQTAANTPSESVAEQRVEKFRGNMQGVQQLLAAGPQGMPPQGMPPQGMPPQGMPQQGPQMAYGGGIIELNNGGEFEDYFGNYGQGSGYSGDFYARQGVPEEAMMAEFGPGADPSILRRAIGAFTGAQSLQDVRDNPLGVAGRTGLNALMFAFPAARLAGMGGRALMGAAGIRGAGQMGISQLLRGGRRFATDPLARNRYMMGLGEDMLKATTSQTRRGRFSAAGGGRKFRQWAESDAGKTALSRFGTGKFQSQATIDMLTRAGRNRLASGAAVGGVAGLQGMNVVRAIMDDGSLSEAEKAEIMESYQGAMQGMGPGAGEGAGETAPPPNNLGGGISNLGSAVAGDMERAFMNRRDNLLRYEEWLRTGTTEEDELDSLMEQRSADIMNRYNPESDKSDLLTQLLIGGARAVEDPSSAVESLADTANIVTRAGEAQRGRREALEDLSFDLSSMPAQRAALRSRQTVAPQMDAAIADLQQQLASLRGIDLQTQRALQSAAMQISAANEFNIKDLGPIQNLIHSLKEENKMSPFEANRVMEQFTNIITSRLEGEELGYQMGGRNNPLGQAFAN